MTRIDMYMVTQASAFKLWISKKWVCPTKCTISSLMEDCGSDSMLVKKHFCIKHSCFGLA